MSGLLTDVLPSQLANANELMQTNGFTWIVPLSVLVASLVGSLHCVSMCGPFALNFASDRKRILAYQGGRFISYVGVGALAGGVGQSVLGSTRIPWLSQLSLAFIAVTLIFMGVRTLMGKGFHMRLPGPLQRASQSLWRKLHSLGLPSWGVAGGTGLLSVFLPCGHLYGFFIGAMATGHWWAGAVFMFAFWLGTVPALGFGAAWVRSLLKPGVSRAPRLAGLVLITAGVFSVVSFATRLQSGTTAHAEHAGHGMPAGMHEMHGSHSDTSNSASDASEAAGSSTPTHHH